MSTTNANPSKDKLPPSMYQSAEHQHKSGPLNLRDDDAPILYTNVSHNSHEHILPNINQPAGHLHPRAIIDPTDEDEKGNENDDDDEDEDEDELISDLNIADLGTESEDENNETVESDSESEPELNFGPAIPTDKDDAAMLQRLLEEKRAPLGAAFRDLAIQINDRRRGPRGTIGLATSYLDQDTSGTYDPKKQRRRLPPIKRNIPHIRRAVNENGPKKVTPESSIGNELKVTFRFKKDSSLNYLRSIVSDAASTSISSSANNSTSSASLSYSDSGDETKNFALAPPKRKHKKRRKIEVQAALERDDGLTLKDLTEGHPQRRGCKACFLSGNDDCSFLGNHNHYPCTACDDASVDCELIVPPVLKKSCERCKRNRITCSYKLTGGRGFDKCEACDKTDQPCCAAPLNETSAYSKRFTSVLDTPVPAPSPAVPPPPVWERRYKACQQCRNAQPQINCSLKSKRDNGPCKCCKTAGQECRFVLPTPSQIKQMEEAAATAAAEAKLSKRVKKLSGKGKITAREKHRQIDPFKKGKDSTAVIAPLPKQCKPRGSKKQERLLAKSKKFANSKHNRLGSLLAPEVMNTTNGIRHKYIETAFSHPIIFNYEPPEDSTDPCSWCTSPLFGMWGHGEIKVEVIPHGGARGNEEIGPGHYNSGKPQSKMCVSCTMARVRITTCKSHKITPIPNTSSRTFSATEYNDSLQALHAGDEKGGVLAKTTKWCSICTSIADFSCCQPNPFPDPDFVGCGLNLCRICQWTLGRIERGLGKRVSFNVMDQLVKLRKRELYNWEGDEVRADSEFLRSDGEMMVRFREGM